MRVVPRAQGLNVGVTAPTSRLLAVEVVSTVLAIIVTAVFVEAAAVSSIEGAVVPLAFFMFVVGQDFGDTDGRDASNAQGQGEED